MPMKTDKNRNIVRDVEDHMKEEWQKKTETTNVWF